MKRFIALLRGINVSGKNKIAMKDLKAGFQNLGFSEVVTCLNSGNIIFSSEPEDEKILSDKIAAMIQNRFDLTIPVFIILQEELAKKLKNAPDWWGSETKEMYDNLIFLMPSFSYSEFYDKIGEPKAEYEQVQSYKDVVFWSFDRQHYQKTNWWSKTAGPGVKDYITIRTANTVKKIAEM